MPKKPEQKENFVYIVYDESESDFRVYPCLSDAKDYIVEIATVGGITENVSLFKAQEIPFSLSVKIESD